MSIYFYLQTFLNFSCKSLLLFFKFAILIFLSFLQIYYLDLVILSFIILLFLKNPFSSKENNPSEKNIYAEKTLCNLIKMSSILELERIYI